MTTSSTGTPPAPQDVLLDPERARACLNAAGVPVDEVVITYRRVLDDHGVVAYRLHGADPSGTRVSTPGYARWAPGASTVFSPVSSTSSSNTAASGTSSTGNRISWARISRRTNGGRSSR